MTCTLWLITESQYDGQIAKTIIHKHHPALRVEVVKVDLHPNISLLDSKLDDLVILVRGGKPRQPFGENDCIVVLHDDDQIERHRHHHESIAKKCQKHGIAEVIAKDELEAWLLSDTGVCKWLSIKPQTCNTERRPSDRLKREMDSKKRLTYPTRLDQLLPHIVGDGKNESLLDALKRLKASPCVK